MQTIAVTSAHKPLLQSISGELIRTVERVPSNGLRMLCRGARRSATTATDRLRSGGRLCRVALSPSPPAEVDVLDLGRDLGLLLDRVVVASLSLFVDPESWDEGRVVQGE